MNTQTRKTKKPSDTAEKVSPVITYRVEYPARVYFDVEACDRNSATLIAQTELGEIIGSFNDGRDFEGLDEGRVYLDVNQGGDVSVKAIRVVDER